MVNFAKSRKEALAYVSATESAQKLSDKALHRLHTIDKTEPLLSRYVEVWSIVTELGINDSFQQVQLFIGLPEEFPLKLPKVYLAKADRDRLAYLPHVDDDGEVCVFDNEGIHLDWQQPGPLATECIMKARRILEIGLRGENQADFEEEFSAYWDQIYHKQDKVVSELSMLDGKILPEGPLIKLVSIFPAYEGYNFIVHSDSEEFDRVKKFLIDAKFRLVEGTALFLGISNRGVPFFETNSTALDFINREFPKLKAEFQRYVSKGNNPIVVIFARAVQGKFMFYGWKIGPLTLARQGFRKSELKPWTVFTEVALDARKPVTRVKFDTLTNERLIMRTQGVAEPDTPRRIVMIGLGSIGSNLLPYFTATELARLDLVDPDIMAMENIHRHLLGMDYIKRYKVRAMEAYLKSSNPLLNVVAHNISVVPFIGGHPDLLKEADMVVVCLGNTNLEHYIFSRLADSDARNAAIVIWVEPFLAGAHCLYLRPHLNLDFSVLFDQGIFRYNIINSSEYADPGRKMLLKEGGCQASYIPYGRQSISRFLATLAPHLFDLLENPAEKNYVLSFKGSESAICQSGLRLSEFGNGIGVNTIQIIELNDDPAR
jgi:hypothetical protein